MVVLEIVGKYGDHRDDCSFSCSHSKITPELLIVVEDDGVNY